MGVSSIGFFETMYSSSISSNSYSSIWCELFNALTLSYIAYFFAHHSQRATRACGTKSHALLRVTEKPNRATECDTRVVSCSNVAARECGHNDSFVMRFWRHAIIARSGNIVYNMWFAVRLACCISSLQFCSTRMRKTKTDGIRDIGHVQSNLEEVDLILTDETLTSRSVLERRQAVDRLTEL